MKKLTVILLILVLGFFLTGCKVTGGGWFYDQNGNKCTLGFNAQADDETGEAKGQFQFNDHAGTKIHASVTGLWELEGQYYIFWGETKDGEYVGVEVQDLGEPGVDAGDNVWVRIDSMEWYGSLGGGNIQAH